VYRRRQQEGCLITGNSEERGCLGIGNSEEGGCLGIGNTPSVAYGRIPPLATYCALPLLKYPPSNTLRCLRSNPRLPIFCLAASSTVSKVVGKHTFRVLSFVEKNLIEQAIKAVFRPPVWILFVA
jgi:hypothetical protein